MKNYSIKIKPAVIFGLILFFCTLAGAQAQDTGLVLRRLSAADGPGGARITVTEKGEAASIVRMASSARRTSKVSGYRVRIFFDNKQDARNNAYGALNRFRELFPGIPSDLKYDNPDFKVTVGNCLTNEEAIILWGKIKGQFPKAFLIPEEIPLDAFTTFSADVQDPSNNETAGN